MPNARRNPTAVATIPAWKLRAFCSERFKQKELHSSFDLGYDLCVQQSDLWSKWYFPPVSWGDLRLITAASLPNAFFNHIYPTSVWGSQSIYSQIRIYLGSESHFKHKRDLGEFPWCFLIWMNDEKNERWMEERWWERGRKKQRSNKYNKAQTKNKSNKSTKCATANVKVTKHKCTKST